jgi:hypothetical protein
MGWRPGRRPSGDWPVAPPRPGPVAAAAEISLPCRAHLALASRGEAWGHCRVSGPVSPSVWLPGRQSGDGRRRGSLGRLSRSRSRSRLPSWSGRSKHPVPWQRSGLGPAILFVWGLDMDRVLESRLCSAAAADIWSDRPGWAGTAEDRKERRLWPDRRCCRSAGC